MMLSTTPEGPQPNRTMRPRRTFAEDVFAVVSLAVLIVAYGLTEPLVLTAVLYVAAATVATVLLILLVITKRRVRNNLFLFALALAVTLEGFFLPLVVAVAIATVAVPIMVAVFYYRWKCGT